MVSFARRGRTIRMCSLDARGEGPIQASLATPYGDKSLAEIYGGLIAGSTADSRPIPWMEQDERLKKCWKFK